MLPDEVEQTGPLVLPHPGPGGAGDHHRGAVLVAGERAQHVRDLWSSVSLECVTLLVALVAFLVVNVPGGTGHGVAPVLPLLHRHEVQDTPQGAGGGLGVS